VPFAIKEEYSLLHSVTHSPCGADVGTPRDTVVSMKGSKNIKGSENRRKTDSFQPQSSEEERQIKRQRRLVKNRESAQLSRMRKKIYIDDLEGKVSTLMTENISLKEEVINLRNVIKQLSGGNYNGPRTAGAAPNASLRSATYNPLTLHSRNAIPARNTQAAGVCLLIVFFSLGLLFNVASTTSNIVVTRPSSPDHRPRRETAHFSSQRLLNSSEIDVIDGFVSDNVMEIAESAGPSHKRCIMQDFVDEDSIPSVHKKIKSEHPSPSTVETTDINQDEANSYNDPDSSSPVAIAVVVPSQQTQDLGFLSTSVYRSLNVHIWPTLR